MRAAAIAGVVAAGVLLGGCGSSTGEVVFDLADFDTMGADQLLLGVTHHMTRDGLRRGFLRAETGYIFDDSAKAHLIEPRMTLYDDDGQESADLVGREGDLYLDTEFMILRGEVVVTTYEPNRRITTAELNFDCQSDRVWSDSATVMVEDGTRVEGDGFFADCRMREIEIRGARARGLQFQF